MLSQVVSPLRRLGRVSQRRYAALLAVAGVLAIAGAVLSTRGASPQGWAIYGLPGAGAALPAVTERAADGASRGIDLLAGPVAARVIRVLDGDTLLVRAHIWVGQEVEVKVRLRGIDTPELAGRCAAERALALKARTFLERAVAQGEVHLTHVGLGKYAGRVLADVSAEGTGSIAAALVATGLARPYAGGKRSGWCGT